MASCAIRPLTPNDLALARDFFHSLCPASLRRRSLGSVQSTDQQLASLVTAKRALGHLGVTAICGAGAGARIPGVARYGSTRPRQMAECAVIAPQLLAPNASPRGCCNAPIDTLRRLAIRCWTESLSPTTRRC